MIRRVNSCLNIDMKKVLNIINIRKISCNNNNIIKNILINNNFYSINRRYLSDIKPVSRKKG